MKIVKKGIFSSNEIVDQAKWVNSILLFKQCLLNNTQRSCFLPYKFIIEKGKLQPSSLVQHL